MTNLRTYETQRPSLDFLSDWKKSLISNRDFSFRKNDFRNGNLEFNLEKTLGPPRTPFRGVCVVCVRVVVGGGRVWCMLYDH